MMLSAEAVGKRYAIRPGCRFLGYREVGLAVFSMNLRILSLETRTLPPIDEFLMRFMVQGIDTTGGLARILGLPRVLVRDRLVELRRSECIDVVGTDAEDGEQCRLTPRGQSAARELSESVMQELTVPNVIYHGLLRRPVDLGSQARRQYLRPKEVKEAGLLPIRAIPNRYPRPEEIDVHRLDRILKSGPKKHRANPAREAVAIKGVLRNVNTLYEPAIMLEYETVDGKHERQVAFAIEGKLQEEYEAAFARADGPKRLRDLLLPAEDTIEERVRREVSPDLIVRLGAFGDAEKLADHVATVEQEVEDAKAELKSVERPDTRQVQRDRIVALESELAAAKKDRDALKVKYLWTPEIRAKLWEAIRGATERLLILSGWVSSEVVDDMFVSAMRAALHRGVRVWIGYGFDKDTQSGQEQRARSSWKDAEAALKELQKEHPTAFVFRDIGYTHEKRLICDSRFTFGGSFNLLSFSGERRGRGRLRHEGADLIEDARHCDELFERYIKRFFST